MSSSRAARRGGSFHEARGSCDSTSADGGLKSYQAFQAHCYKSYQGIEVYSGKLKLNCYSYPED